MEDTTRQPKHPEKTPPSRGRTSHHTMKTRGQATPVGPLGSAQPKETPMCSGKFQASNLHDEEGRVVRERHEQRKRSVSGRQQARGAKRSSEDNSCIMLPNVREEKRRERPRHRRRRAFGRERREPRVIALSGKNLSLASHPGGEECQSPAPGETHRRRRRRAEVVTAERRARRAA